MGGLRTTYGSPIFAGHVPARDQGMVRRLREAGGTILCKTNTPEFGAGANTRNAVYGATGNPGGALRALLTGASMAHRVIRCDRVVEPHADLSRDVAAGGLTDLTNNEQPGRRPRPARHARSCAYTIRAFRRPAAR